MELFSVVGGTLLDTPCMVFQEEEEEEMNFIETHDSYKKLRQKYCLYNYEIVHTV